MNFLLSYNIRAESIFNILIVKNEIPSSDTTILQYSIVLISTKENVLKNEWNLFSIFVNAILLERGEDLITLYNIPTRY